MGFLESNIQSDICTRSSVVLYSVNQDSPLLACILEATPCLVALISGLYALRVLPYRFATTTIKPTSLAWIQLNAVSA